jgi:hypothetical protein
MASDHNARMTKGSKMASKNINETMTYVMWLEEYLWMSLYSKEYNIPILLIIGHMNKNLRFGHHELYLCWGYSCNNIPIEGILPDGRINKMADLQETKFLSLFGLTDVQY